MLLLVLLLFVVCWVGFFCCLYVCVVVCCVGVCCGGLFECYED